MLEYNMSLANCREENSCESIFSSLIDVLRKELAICQELKDIIIREKMILIKPSLDELNHNNAIKENIILKARMLEEARVNILKKIARNLDINISGIKLSQLAVYADTEQRKEIDEIIAELALISQDINALNETNKDLLDVSLSCIKGSLDFINSIMSQGTVYVESGQMKTIQNNGKFLRTEG